MVASKIKKKVTTDFAELVTAAQFAVNAVKNETDK